jgi:glycyl-tRNA synthetase
VHSQDKLAHYAKACTDIVFDFPFGKQELMGIAARGNFDLTQHALHSTKNLEYFDPGKAVKYLPHVIEPSIGVERLFLAILVANYREEMLDNEKRVVLGFTPKIAPIKAAVLPLLGNKHELISFAEQIAGDIRKKYLIEVDTSGAIGRRYRRADEIGIPFCVTVDFESIRDGSVTVRFRDSMKQIRMPAQDLLEFLTREIEE